jgi:hypothetical protein
MFTVSLEAAADLSAADASLRASLAALAASERRAFAVSEGLTP